MPFLVSKVDSTHAEMARELSWETAGASSFEQALQAMFGLLEAAIPSDQIVWNAVDVDGQAVELLHSDDLGDAGAAMARLLLDVADDHPMVLSYLRADKAGTDPRRMSDVTTRSQLRRTRAWSDLLHPHSADYQLTVLTGRDGASGSCWTFNRANRDFTDRELELATRLQPALRALTAAIMAEHTSRARFDVDHMVAAQDRQGLTSREVEVLSLVGRGLTAVAVARVLRISPRTVHKHLEHAYTKLGCHDRLIAVDRGRQLGVLAIDNGR